jgi:CheY-like chemotaxis protein
MWGFKSKSKKETPHVAVEIQPEPQAVAQGFNLLIVDDDTQMLALLTKVSSMQLNCTVWNASSGAEAVEILQQQPFDLVVCDLSMEGGDGMQVFNWVASSRPELVLRFLIITGALASHQMAPLIQGMGVRILSKPFQIDEYVGVCREMLGTA